MRNQSGQIDTVNPQRQFVQGEEQALSVNELQVDAGYLQKFNSSRYYTKLDKLLAQPDIFSTLRKIESGQIKSFDNLDINAQQKYDQVQATKRMRAAAAGVELVESDDDFQIYQLDSQPQNIEGGKLKDYQLEGLNWLFKLYQASLNGILADEMGLGKTIESISILALVESLKTPQEIQARKSYHIVIVPKVTLGNWVRELRTWVPSIRVFKFYGGAADKDALRAELQRGEFDVLLTTYEMCMKEKRDLVRIQFEYLILDEAQRIKNASSVLSHVLRQFRTRNRVLLTGTPLQNELKELWALLNFLMPKLFDSADDFKALFAVADEKRDQPAEQKKCISQIQRLLRPFMLRRLRIDVEHNIPEKKEIHLSIGLTKLQKKLYGEIITGNITSLRARDKTQLHNVLMQLKKCCNHPYLFERQEPGPPFIDGEHLVDASMKFKVLDCLIPKCLSEGCRILIFSQMTKLLDILDDFLRYRGHNYCRLDGQTSAADRDARIEDFQKPDSSKQIFILSTRAGGLGINLHSANVVILFDSDWNPQVDLQAMHRAHRIGQKRDVIVYRLVTADSVEEKIIERAARKLRVDHLIMQRGQFTHKNKDKDANADEMLNIIEHGAQEILVNCDEEEDIKANLDEIIEKSMRKTAELQEKLKSLEQKYDLHNVALTGEADGKKSSMFGPEKEKKPAESFLSLVDPNMGSRAKATRLSTAENIRKALEGQNKKEEKASEVPVKKEEKKKLPKGWKNHYGGGFDHQFFDNAKLDAFEKKEFAWMQYSENPSAWKKEVPPEFTEQEQQEKQSLLEQGFSQWNKRDFFKFVQMCELFGRDSCDQYTELFALGKTYEQIKEYSDAFWANFTRIKNYQKYIERIERGEQELNKRNSIDKAILDKFEQLKEQFLKKHPEKTLADFTYKDIHIKYQRPLDPGMFDFGELEDKIYAMGMYKFTYGFFDLIRNSIRNYEELRLDWAAQTRSVDEIRQRCDFLITQFQAELTGKSEPMIVPQKLIKAEIVPKKLPQKRGRKPKQPVQEETFVLNLYKNDSEDYELVSESKDEDVSRSPK